MLADIVYSRYTCPVLGVFDSGVGGLTVLRSIRERLPDLAVTYLGDSARTPYGNRSRETVTKYTKECCIALFDRGCTLIVLACNTASADTLRELQKTWLPEMRKKYDHHINILGVIRPLAEEAVARTIQECIGVVGTRSTVASGTFPAEFEKLKTNARIVQQACPLLVPLVEEGWEKKPETARILRNYLRPLKSRNPDMLILGCTHYEALHNLFAKQMGSRTTVLHTPSIVADKLGKYLERHPEYAMQKTGEILFLTTGSPERFCEVGSRFFGQRIANAERIDVVNC